MHPSRRSLLQTAATLVGLASLAGCGDAKTPSDTQSTGTPVGTTAVAATSNTDMTDKVHFQTDDTGASLTENALQESLGTSNANDYVERGFGLTADFGANTLDVEAGKAFLEPADGLRVTVLADARSGLSLTDSATNYVYVAFDPDDASINDATTADPIRIEVNTTGTPPSDPSLLVGEVDTSSDTVIPQNRNPTGSFQAVYTGDSRATNRIEPIYEANQIRQEAGVPPAVTAGVRSSASPGLSDAGAVSSASAIEINSESDASAEADSGSGTESDPYVIRDREIANTGTDGFRWDDSDSDYYIRVENCTIHDNNFQQTFVNIGSKLVFQNCLIYGTGGQCVRQQAGTVEAREVNFAGALSNRTFQAGPDKSIIVDCLFDDSQASAGSSAVYCVGSDLEMRHCTVDGSYSDAVNHVTSSKIQWERSKVRGVSQGFNGASTATLKAGSSFKFLDIGSVSSVCLQAEGDNAGDETYNYEVANCTFGDATNRQVVFAVDDDGEMPAGWDVHHCKFTKTSGDQTAGNECLESFSGKNIRFAYNWVTECPEDAFEHANARENVTIEHSVADNCTGNAADLFNATDGENINARIHHIYGNTEAAPAVVTAGVSDFHIHDIIIGVATGDLIRVGGAPDNALITGPLSDSSVVAGDLLSAPEGLGTNSSVIYWDGTQLVTEGGPPANWTTPR